MVQKNSRGLTGGGGGGWESENRALRHESEREQAPRPQLENGTGAGSPESCMAHRRFGMMMGGTCHS